MRSRSPAWATSLAPRVTVSWGPPCWALLSPWEGMFLQVSLIIDWGPVNLYLGKIESLLGRHDDAVAHLEDALRATHAAELTIWEALAQAELSRALRGRGAVTDIVRSEELAGQALSTSRRLGLRRVERRLP